jgi:hypothetical protein
MNRQVPWQRQQQHKNEFRLCLSLSASVSKASTSLKLTTVQSCFVEFGSLWAGFSALLGLFSQLCLNMTSVLTHYAAMSIANSFKIQLSAQFFYEKA